MYVKLESCAALSVESMSEVFLIFAIQNIGVVIVENRNILTQLLIEKFLDNACNITDEKQSIKWSTLAKKW